MIRRAALGALLLLLLVGAPALAVEPDERLADPVLEARARDISRQLRCLVCQNQSIDDSAAPLARDLRLLLRERLTAGDSDAEAIAFITARYGDYVLLRPPFQANTLLLWLGPGVLLLLGAIGVAMFFIRRSRAPAASPLTAEERAALDRLAAGGPAP